MKWLPIEFREAQRDFFRKRGLPWHITYAIRLRSSSSSALSTSNSRLFFEHRAFRHVFDNVKQNDGRVTSILFNVTIWYSLFFLATNATINPGRY